MLAFVRDNARWLAGGLLLTMFSSFGQTFFIGLSGNDIRAAFSLSDGEFGGLYMMCTLASAFTLPWLGKRIDTQSSRSMILFVMPGFAAACVLMAIAPHVILLAISLYLLRLLGQGMMTHIALTEVSRWFSLNRGRAISLIVPGHQIGEAILPVAFVMISGAAGWRAAWIVAAAVIVLLALPAILLLLRVERVPSSAEMAAASARVDNDWTRAEVLRDPMFYLVLVGVLAPAFVGTTIFFHQGHLISLRGYDALAFAAAFPLMAATTVIFGLVSGTLIDRFGAVRMLPFFLLPLIAASLAAALITSLWGIYVFMFLLGISYGLTSTLLGALWPEMYGIRHLGGIRAMVVAAMVFATALGPGLTGALIDRGIYLPQQLLWMAGWCAAGTLGLIAGSRRILQRSLADGTS